jgi:c-di-GMP-binding flagellar brake protein YcgR
MVTTQSTGNERRKYKRVKGKVKITYKVMGETGEEDIFAMDISAGGFCLGLDRILKKDTVLELVVNLPDKDKSFFCLGRVVWQNLKSKKDEGGKRFYETGLQFSDLDLKNRLRLIYYVHGKMNEAEAKKFADRYEQK